MYAVWYLRFYVPVTLFFLNQFEHMYILYLYNHLSYIPHFYFSQKLIPILKTTVNFVIINNIRCIRETLCEKKNT